MGFSKSSYKTPPPPALIIRQWDSESGAAPLFWAPERVAKDTSDAATIPAKPVLLPKIFRSKGSQLEKRQPAQRLPPLLAYESGSHHIFEHSLSVVDGHVDVQVNRWGPGVRLTQTQPTTELFDKLQAAMPDGSNVSVSATMLTGRIRNLDDHCAYQLYAVAVDGGDGDGAGSMEIKYLVKKTREHKKPLLTTDETFAAYEQTIRLAEDSETPRTSPLSTPVQFNICSVGGHVEYLVFTTLRPGTAKAPSILSLYTVEQNLAIADALAIAAPNQDRGLRWQLQNVELPGHIVKTAPIVLTVLNVQFLFLFYVGSDGEMRHTSLRYAGSGRWEAPVNNIPCQVGAAPAQAAAATSRSRSRFSLSSYVSFPSTENDMEQAKEKIEEVAPEQEPILAREGTQPYVVKADGILYVLFEGADGNGKYLYHDIAYDARGLHERWTAVSWKVPPPKETDGQRAARHFIPVAVAFDFMAMS